MRWFPLSLLILCSLATPSFSQGQKKKQEKKEEKKERFFGKVVVAKLDKYRDSYDKRRIVTANGTIVGIFSIKPKKDSKQDDWGMVVRLKVGGQLPLVYLGTYGALDEKMKPLHILDKITIRGSLSSRPLRLVAVTLWKKGD